MNEQDIKKQDSRTVSVSSLDDKLNLLHEDIEVIQEKRSKIESQIWSTNSEISDIAKKGTDPSNIIESLQNKVSSAREKMISIQGFLNRLSELLD